ncbi:hypothetical protein O181_062674 [Austropuccinia psidii MF-1]|uniref:Uncharacterized protein n=1 Tax=Austropuccinia psidii MF-1 TaxID=1389203 RepID=A0A9Q3EKK7_9BASI|nr:hypothetical protein [Austropuccinia psidii MF-1]
MTPLNRFFAGLIFSPQVALIYVSILQPNFSAGSYNTHRPMELAFIVSDSPDRDPPRPDSQRSALASRPNEKVESDYSTSVSSNHAKSAYLSPSAGEGFLPIGLKADTQNVHSTGAFESFQRFDRQISDFEALSLKQDHSFLDNHPTWDANYEPNQNHYQSNSKYDPSSDLAAQSSSKDSIQPAFPATSETNVYTSRLEALTWCYSYFGENWLINHQLSRMMEGLWFNLLDWYRINNFKTSHKPTTSENSNLDLPRLASFLEIVLQGTCLHMDIIYDLHPQHFPPIDELKTRSMRAGFITLIKFWEFVLFQDIKSQESLHLGLGKKMFDLLARYLHKARRYFDEFHITYDRIRGAIWLTTELWMRVEEPEMYVEYTRSFSLDFKEQIDTQVLQKLQHSWDEVAAKIASGEQFNDILPICQDGMLRGMRMPNVPEWVTPLKEHPPSEQHPP